MYLHEGHGCAVIKPTVLFIAVGLTVSYEEGARNNETKYFNLSSGTAHR